MYRVREVDVSVNGDMLLKYAESQMRQVSQSLKELCHDILSHFWEVQNHFQTEEILKIIVY